MESIMHEAFTMSPIGQAGDPRSLWWRKLGQSLGRLRSAVAAAQRRRLGIHQLQRLDDRMLADIGISRSQIESAARGWSRPAPQRRQPVA
jgi:uncharacterized protein YjiS (DUF1127 family)